MRTAIIVVDMLRGFLEPQTKLVETWDKTPVYARHELYCGDKARDIIPPVVCQLNNAVENDTPIFFVCDEHERNDKEFAIFPPHCIKHTKQAEIIPELVKFATANNVIKKNRYSGFFGTNLHQELQAQKINTLVVVGVCTDICVMHTVADARNYDYHVVVPREQVASFNEDNHQFALRHMKEVLGAVIE